MSLIDIDIQTAIKLRAIADVSVAFLLLLYRKEEGFRHALALFLGGQILNAIGMVLISLRGEIPILVSAQLGNIVVYGGIALQMFAFTLVCKSRFQFKAAFAVIFLVGALLFLSIDLLLSDQTPTRAHYVLVSSLVVGCLYGLGGMGLLGAHYSSLLRKVLAAIFIVLALFYFGRVYLAQAYGMAIFTPHPVQSLTFVVLLVASIVCGLGFLLVAHEESDQALRLAAITDPLTKLDNRRRFNEVLNNEYFRLKRSGAQLSLIMIDVDHFKRFNDRYGHVQGDECLRRVGQAIKSAVCRASDAAARFGGEEFVVVAPETDTAGALALAENIRQALEGLAIPHDGNSAASCVTASLGVVTRYVSELKTPEALVDLADQALYRAKQAGRNRTEVMRRLEGEISKGPGLVQLVWNDVAESGNAALDEQHKELFEQANVLLSAVVEGLPRLECKSLLNQMLEALVAHFEFEEAIIRNTSFTHIEHHIQCHKALVAKAHELSDRFDRNELAVGELFSFLANKVVAQHILSEDRKFFPYLRHSL
ncbi:MAG: diguanylate cyclase [Propionivibrio sp.]|nr:diguanylate cyclase [Propionivibrio sp.]